MREPNIITKGWLSLSDLQFCEDVAAAINRDPNRRAVVKRKGCCCRVVDYSEPIREQRCKRDYGPIIGWEPMI